MLVLSNEAISKAIREKKKKMATTEPEPVGTNPRPDMDAQAIYDTEQHARVESTLGSPKKINADETMLNQEYDGVGLSPEEKGRMGRLRKYMDSLEIT